MTVTELPGAWCDRCERRVGNLSKHQRACLPPVAEPVEITIVRAGAHAADPESLPFEARLRDGITDLDMARLLRALECGTQVVYNGRTWRAPIGSPLGSNQRLTGTVSEGIRLGLVRHAIVRTGPHTQLQVAAPAPVHLRSATDVNRPACPQPVSFKRYRLMNADSLEYVDCLTCLDLA